MLTAERLRELLHYDPETGVFMWRKSGSGRKFGVPAGAICGRPPGYRYIMIDGASYQAHRLAWLYLRGEWPEELIDHKYHDTHDNKFDNLRQATHAQNGYNSRRFKNNTSGYRGVYRNNRTGKFIAQARLYGKMKYLGVFDTAEAASKAYVKATEYRGEYVYKEELDRGGILNVP